MTLDSTRYCSMPDSRVSKGLSFGGICAFGGDFVREMSLSICDLMREMESCAPIRENCVLGWKNCAYRLGELCSRYGKLCSRSGELVF